MLPLRGLLTLALVSCLAVPALAAPAPGRTRNRRHPNQTLRGTVVSVRPLSGPGQNGSLTIRSYQRYRGRGRSARAALRRTAHRGGMHTFHVNGATRIERNGRGRLALRSLRRGEYVLVVASGPTARVIDVLGRGAGRRLHPLVRHHRRAYRHGLGRRSPRFVRRRVYHQPFHPLVHRRVSRTIRPAAHRQVHRRVVARPKPPVHRPPSRRTVKVVQKQVVKHPPRPVARKPVRKPPVKHTLSRPPQKPKPHHPPAHHPSRGKGGRKR